jgi:hypothetical protein
LVFDPADQEHVPEGRVQLFIRRDGVSAVFVSAMVKSGLGDLGPTPELESAVDYYVQLKAGGVRETKCYTCQAILNSAEFPTCPTCRKIRCRCGACMCEYAGGDNGVSRWQTFSAREINGPGPILRARSEDGGGDWEEDDEEHDRVMWHDLGTDPEDPDMDDLSAEGMGVDERDWESEDHDRD